MKWRFGILLVAVVLFAVGCGSDGETTAAVDTDTVATDTSADTDTVATDTSAAADTTASGITKEEYIKEVDALCSKVKADITEQAAGITSQAEATTFLKETALPAARGLFDEIEALGAPAGDEDTVAEFLAAERDALDAAEADPTGATSETDKANQLLTDYGLVVCGAA